MTKSCNFSQSTKNVNSQNIGGLSLPSSGNRGGSDAGGLGGTGGGAGAGAGFGFGAQVGGGLEGNAEGIPGMGMSGWGNVLF